MGPAEALAILGAGVAAGAVNAVVGSGSLITFPTLLAFGFPPVVANVSNNVGLVSGNVSGAVGYRRELAGQRARLIRLGVIAAAGSVAGRRRAAVPAVVVLQAHRAGADPHRLRARDHPAVAQRPDRRPAQATRCARTARQRRTASPPALC